MAAITRLRLAKRSFFVPPLPTRTFSSSQVNAPPHAAAASFRRGPRSDILSKRCVQWVFLGCPGVGKGTYASRLSNLLDVPHIATGDLVRDELASSGPLSSQVFIFLLLCFELSSLLFGFVIFLTRISSRLLKKLFVRRGA